MGLRLTIAKKYATITAPKLLKFKNNKKFREVVVSQSLLFRTRVSRDLTRAVSPPLLFAHDLATKARLSCPEITRLDIIPPLPETQISDLLLDGSVLVSGNLLTPIGTPDPRGKDYAAPHDQPELFPDADIRRQEVLREDRKAYAERRVRDGVMRQTVSLWDMIFPLLKPPVDFDFPTQLDFPSVLYPFQVEGVRRLVENESFLLADEMGTGKTVMASVALRVLFHKGAVRRALIVCPATIIPVWDRHLEDWGGACLTCTVVRGPVRTRQNDWEHPAHIYITSYDTLRSDVLGKSTPLLGDSALKKFDLVILDEAHHIKNPSSGRSKATLKLTPKYRWALTGTPLQNKLDDLIAIFRFVRPRLLSSQLVSKATVMKSVEPYFLRRRKMDVLHDLPEKITQDMWLELDSEQQEAYEEALGRGRDEFTSGSRQLTRIHIFALLRKLMQICNFAPGETTSPKLELLLDQLDEVLEEHKVIVFTNYLQEGVEKLRPHLQQYGLVEITGKTPSSRRAAAIDRFQKDPDIRVFLGTTKTAGEGITLTEGNYVFHFDQWWNPAVAWQAEDRAHRKGQAKQVNVYNYWMEKTIEERIRQKLKQKGLLFDEVVNAMSEEEIKATMTMEDWCEVLGLDVKLAPSRGKGAQTTEGDRNLGEVYKTLYEMHPSDFERITAEVFHGMGYSTRLTGQSYDGGIDIRASKSVVGGKELIVIQCKRKAQVGVDVARELLGVVSADPKISKGFLAVSGKISQKCREFIEQHGNLSYMEGLELAKRIMELGVSIPM